MNKKLYKVLFTALLTLGIMFGNITAVTFAAGGNGGGGGGGTGGGSGSGGGDPVTFTGAYLTTISDNVSTTGTEIKDNQKVDLNPMIKLIFNKNVVSSTVWDINKTAIALADSSGNQIDINVDRIPDKGENSNDNEKRHIFIQPIDSLIDGQTYTLVIKSKLTANNGTKLGKEEQINFTVAKADVTEDAVKIVEDLITNLPLSKDLTISNKAAIENARKTYESLTKEEQDLVENIDKLVELEAKLVELLEAELEPVKKVEELIKKLPKAEDLTMSDKALVIEAQQAYNRLTDSQKELVKNNKKLTEAEIKLKELENQITDEDEQDNPAQNTEQNTVNPTDESTKNDKNILPKTGDASAVWTSLFGFFLLATGLVMLKTKKKSRVNI